MKIAYHIVVEFQGKNHFSWTAHNGAWIRQFSWPKGGDTDNYPDEETETYFDSDADQFT
jgi:hypothetical protein